MGLTAEQLKHGLDSVARIEPRFATALERTGYPEPRIRQRGYATLMRTIVGQQVSVAAAASMWRKFEAHLGPELPPEKVLESDFDTLRACGLSKQKQGYMRSLCELVVKGELDFDALPADDEAAIAQRNDPGSPYRSIRYRQTICPTKLVAPKTLPSSSTAVLPSPC